MPLTSTSGDTPKDSQSLRQKAVAAATDYFDRGDFLTDFTRRVAIPSSSQDPERKAALDAYLSEEMKPYLEELGFTVEILANPVRAESPFLYAERLEGPDLPTVLTYGHADTVQGMEGRWLEGLDPWVLTQRGDRLYGRGTADNKGQHLINLAALAEVLSLRDGKLGYNVKVLLETGEEVGSPGLREVSAANKDRFAADMLLASDGPRVDPDTPTLYMGSRGAYNFSLSVNLRDGAHHSGNWGGVLANAGTRLTHALACLTSEKGVITVPGLRNKPLSNSLTDAYQKLKVSGGDGAPEIDNNWGEPHLSAPERLYGWNTLEILAINTGGDANRAVNAIPGEAKAVCQLRFTPDTAWQDIIPSVQEHLKANGFDDVEVAPDRNTAMPATRLPTDHPMVIWAAESVAETLGEPPALLPNLGGTIPNDVFAEIIGMPTIWVPHSYSGCQQHAPNEHMLAPVARQGLALMAGLWWDLGEAAFPRSA
ncbi:M20 family metallopeptidase [Rhodovibrionaceae bacterium A322]